MNDLFELPATASQTGDEDLHQYFTPEWAAEELIAKFFPMLGATDCVIEPACGRGPFLKSVPDMADAIGVEIDPKLAEIARTNTGRQIICGDFADESLEIPFASAIVGNPPFKMGLVDKFLKRSIRRVLAEATAAKPESSGG